MAETPRHGDIVADTENVLQTVFVYIDIVVFINVSKIVCNFRSVFVDSNEKFICNYWIIFPLRHYTQA